jgi:F1F0 ATPase subunit 2
MSDLARASLYAAGGLLGGAALGAAFFGGLWMTVTRLTAGRGGVLLMPLSLTIRFALLGAGMVLAARFGAATLLGCAAGVLAIRAVALKRVRVASGYPRNAEKGPRS